VADFLLFERMVSIPVLIGFYYLGAVLAPLAAWLLALWLSRRLGRWLDLPRQGRDRLWAQLPLRYRLLVILLALAAFLFMELLWRLLFEYLIAFMQMRDALLAAPPGR